MSGSKNVVLSLYLTAVVIILLRLNSSVLTPRLRTARTESHRESPYLPQNCTWAEVEETPTACVTALDLFLGTVPRPSRWAFFGDSTMMRLFSHGRLSMGTKAQQGRRTTCRDTTVRGHNCNALTRVLGMELSTEWVPPHAGVEGPVSNLTNYQRGCTDMRSGGTHVVECVNATRTTRSLFPCEYARDVELQSQEYGTTQENYGAFLSRRPVDVCVINNGLHDMTIPNITIAQYLSNVQWQLEALSKGCRRFIWLTMSAARAHPTLDKMYIQDNISIKRWNTLVAARVQKIPGIDVFVMDVFPRSKIEPHKDNVHLNHGYYKKLAALFEQVSPNDYAGIIH